ncbi:5-guanidino-2-oxopentanoate decarboxylase [Chromohalobacter nigrandesensis]|uniref:5-guanidino-2-oxopentanoate decarboxylase n=1 Tax=Chromohalobacter nigrandesensis TaxID=119863 RepID=UPI001FF68394|nr:5-guanidino-2-oxopentanoate decarboxylase [Chromohalobacter nigrandesensis]MCK0746149.1 5-guanidino-2-oxopentanoate decarboxylase [Chromohalobacter nigrandesensis]
MTTETNSPYLRSISCAEALVRLLRDSYAVDTVFGIPGVHTVPLYRGLEAGGLRHVTPRHEQGAGFMADGYARASGNPGVCFIITGPGMTNIATAMGQALADSVPMLVISSVNRRDTLGRGQGRLHELPSQQNVLAGVSRFSHTLLDPSALPEVLARAFAVFRSERPGPVHIEIPIDLFDAPISLPTEYAPARLYRPAPHPDGVALAAEWLREAHAPLVLLGGGCADASKSARALVEHLDAPTVTTINAKGVLGRGHPLDLGANATWPEVRALASDADVILAVGTELGETDYDVVFDEGFTLTGRLIRIDLEAEQLVRNQATALGLVSDTGIALSALLAHFPTPLARQGAKRTRAIHEALALPTRPDMAPFVPLYAALDHALPEAIIVGDSTAPVYAGNHLVERAAPRRYFNASTGYGTLGYGLPAALGAQLAKPGTPVVALVGDGGLMFTLSELATAVDEGLPVVVVLWNNAGYEEIRRYMDAHGVARIGVDPTPPDFQRLAEGFGLTSQRIESPAALGLALSNVSRNAPTLIEIDAERWQAALG